MLKPVLNPTDQSHPHVSIPMERSDTFKYSILREPLELRIIYMVKFELIFKSSKDVCSPDFKHIIVLKPT